MSHQLHPNALILGLGIQQANGQYLFETGSKPRNGSTVSFGSRLTYDRDFSKPFIFSEYFYKKHSFKLELSSTLEKTESGTIRDEDFSIREYSEIRSRGYLFPYHHAGYLPKKDTVHVLSGTRNIIESKGKNSIRERFHSFTYKYFLGKSNPDPEATGSYGIFIPFYTAYTYNKYYAEDSIQYYSGRRKFYLLPGRNLTFSNSILLGGIGIGYSIAFKNIFLETSFIPYRVSIRSRDYHQMRNLTFFEELEGYGFIHGISIHYKIIESIFASLHLRNNRMYAYGTFKARDHGDLHTYLIVATTGSWQRIYHSEKELRIDLSLQKLLRF